MNFRHRLAVLIAALALATAPISPFPLQVQKAEAAQTVLCAPNPLDQQSMRTIGGPSSSIPSGTLYTLNGQGCTVAAQQDLGWFLSQGFTAGPPFGPNILYTTGVWTGTTSFQVGVLPPSTYIQHIIFQETAGNAVTGGIKVGSTSGGADVVAAQALGASGLAYVTDASILKRIFSTTATQPIFVTPATAGNNANVTVTIVFGYF